MKKCLIITFCFAVILFFVTGCQTNNSQATKDYNSHLTEKAPAQERKSSENDVTITTEKEQYPTSVEKIIVEIQNDSNTEYMTGQHVFLEKKAENTWYRVPMKADSFTEMAIGHPPGEWSSMEFDVNDLKDELTPGKYRAVIGGLAASFKIVE